MDTTNGKNRKDLSPKYYCKDCGKEISKGSMRCVQCDAKHRIIKEKDMLVTRNELKTLIREKPFTQIGQQFQVSDNAIRKWCDKYHLPRTKKEINSYADEE